MSKRTAIVRKGLKYQKKPQTRTGGSWLPRYPMAVASRETAFRHVWHRRGEYKKYWQELWGADICANHDWTVENTYFPIGGSHYFFYNEYICGLGPDLTLNNGILSYNYANPATNYDGRTEHSIKNYILDEYPSGIRKQTKIKVSFPTVTMIGSPYRSYHVVYIEVQLFIIRENGVSGSTTVRLYHNLLPCLGAGEHEVLLDKGDPVTVTRIYIRTRTSYGTAAIWECDYIKFTKPI